MVVIECTAAGCGWKSADRPEDFAAVLAAELANHTAVKHTAVDIDKTLKLILNLLVLKSETTREVADVKLVKTEINILDDGEYIESQDITIKDELEEVGIDCLLYTSDAADE